MINDRTKIMRIAVLVFHGSGHLQMNAGNEPLDVLPDAIYNS